MHLNVRTCAVLALGAALSAPLAPPAGAAPKAPVVAGYFAQWDIYARNFHPKDVPADKLTHIFYAFAAPDANGHCASLDAWADYQRPYPAEESVDGVADDAANPDQHLFGNFNQLRKLKAAHPGLKIILSLGGFTKSTYFSDAAATPESRAAFAQSCIDEFINGNLPSDAAAWPPQSGGPGSAAGVFDGFDIDWEYPVCCGDPGSHYSPSDRHNATLLFRELRRQLDEAGAATGEHYLLTAALPAANVRSAGSFELGPVSRSVDWINLLTFDFHGPWDTTTNINSPFAHTTAADPTPAGMRRWFNTEGTVRFYEMSGVAPGKLVVGVPFYARQYVRVPGTNNGLYQSFDNTGLDPNVELGSFWDSSPTPSYHGLVDIGHVVGPGRGLATAGQNGYTRYWNRDAKEPFLYNPAGSHAFASGTEVLPTFISYDDPQSIAQRGALARTQGLRGVWAWELSQDSDAHDLVNAMWTGLTG
jgi:chitinase